MAQFLTVRQVADRLNMHYMSVYKLLQSGSLPGTKVGNRWKIDAAKLDQWVHQRPPSTAPVDPTAPNVQVIFLDLATSPRVHPQTYVVALPEEASLPPETEGRSVDSRLDPDWKVLLARPVDPVTARQLLARLPA